MLEWFNKNDFKKSVKVLCIGDIMLDIFSYGQVDRISPEAPVPVLKSLYNKVMLGGAGNVAANLSELGCNVTLVGMIGEDNYGIDVLRLLEKHKYIEPYIVTDKARQTIVKNRFVCGKHHILRVDTESALPLSERSEQQLLDFLSFLGSSFDIIVISDYNKGTLTDKFRKFILSKYFDVLKIVDTKNVDLESFSNCDLIVPNVKELENYVNYKIFSKEQMILAATHVSEKFYIPRVLVTRGESGMILLEQGNTVLELDSFNKNPVDVSGAGDTVVATLALSLSNGKSFSESVELANVAASIVISKSGTATINLQELADKIQVLQDTTDYNS